MNEFKSISELNNSPLSAITSHARKQNWNFFVFVISGSQTFISQIYRVVGPSGEKLNFYRSLVFEAESDFDHKITKLKPQSIRASERYLNNENLIHGRETAMIFLFSAETFESDFS